MARLGGSEKTGHRGARERGRPTPLLSKVTNHHHRRHLHTSQRATVAALGLCSAAGVIKDGAPCAARSARGTLAGTVFGLFEGTASPSRQNCASESLERRPGRPKSTYWISVYVSRLRPLSAVALYRRSRWLRKAAVVLMQPIQRLHESNGGRWTPSLLGVPPALGISIHPRGWGRLHRGAGYVPADAGNFEAERA